MSGPSFVTISYKGIIKDIPIKYNYYQFVEEFKKIFDINEEITDIIFYLLLINGEISVEFELYNEDIYKIVFTSESNMKSQCIKVNGIAITDSNNLIFLNKEISENIITKSISEIQNDKTINYKIKILTKKDNIIFAKKETFLMCVPDDSDIYFPFVEINDNFNVKISELDNLLKYEFKILIKFKNYNNIAPGEKKLKAKIICDTNKNNNKDIGEIIVSVIN